MALPHPWDAYARLQQELSKNPNITNRSWGLEEAMNLVLAASAGEVPTPQEIDRAVAAASRRERHRAQLRARLIEPFEELADTEAGLHAQKSLRDLESQMKAEDWAVLHAIGKGVDYDELAAAHRCSPARLRTRVSRIRKTLSDDLSPMSDRINLPFNVFQPA